MSVDFSKIKSVTIPEGRVKKILQGAVVLWKSGFKNWAFNSLESGGNAIYNNGLGYKIGYRIRSGGAEASEAKGICTGFIPLKIGDTLRIYPAFIKINTRNAINFCDGNFANLGQINDSGSAYGICEKDGAMDPNYKTAVINGVSTLTLTEEKHSADIRYVRITHVRNDNDIAPEKQVNADVSNFIITVNEEFEVPT